MRYAVGVTDEFKVGVGSHPSHRGSVQSPSVFAVIMDRLTDEIRRKSLLNIVFADDVMICSQRRQQVEESL